MIMVNMKKLVKRKDIPSLTGFRAIAALLVAFSHFSIPPIFGSATKNIAYKGYSGVTAFFILSGFVLA